MRKMLCLVLAVILCLSAYPSHAEGMYVIEELQSYESRVKLRKHASTDSEVLGQYFAGTQMTVHSVSDGWAKVTIGNREGYMMSQYLLPADQQPEIELPDALLVSEPYASVTVYERPGLSSPAEICELSGISVLGTVGDDWLHVTVHLMNGGKHSGFVQSNLIARYMVEKMRVTSDSAENLVNFREAPSRKAKAIGKLFAGTKVEVLFDDHVADDGWSKVRVGDLIGYIMDDYLELMYPTRYSVPMTEIKGNHVKVYSDANRTGLLMELGRYDPFYVLGSFGDMYYVCIETWLTETKYGDLYAFVARDDLQRQVTRSASTLGFLKASAQLYQLNESGELEAEGEWKLEGDAVEIYGSVSDPREALITADGYISPEDEYLYVSCKSHSGEEITGYLPMSVVEYDEALVKPMNFVVG